MGKKLNKAPVYYTVAQVQFNPILNLDSYLPAIQAKMREARFPDYRQEVFHRLVLPFGGIEPGGQMASPSVAPQSRHTFGDISGQTSFLLESNTLSFQTTEYDTFEIFSASLLQGLDVLHDIMRLDFIERIGLRYLDAVQPLQEQDTLKDYLVPEVLGLSQKVEGQLMQSISETTSITSAGQLISRVIIRDGNIGLPMELSMLAPTINPRFTQRHGRHAIVDTDASHVLREAFDLTQVKSRLISLHNEIKKSFEMTFTTHAKDAWA
ncbi:TIGR04255 family protein [Rugamonas sp. DEMB1]|uniref:TIGR04255 family protein n=1 Tax=Rugamonas sp. DEMB1 TaxID=3039386 RepID=UPI00244AA283|nr:TIGR04255 family protein [Rugamonas sp. DEMB1]WGG49547.1 TIGR04255 family protein [Rugamonas sp. DEMB1]